MTKALITDDVLRDVELRRVNYLTATGLTPENLREATDEQLLLIQQQIFMGSAWGRWEYPEEWAFGSYTRRHKRTYELKRALPDGVQLDSESARLVWREILRITLAMRLWPGRMGILYKMTTIKATITWLGRIIKDSGLPDGPGFWTHYKRGPTRARFGKWADIAMNQVAHFHAIGALPDGPSSAKRKGRAPLRDRTGEPELSAKADNPKPWQALPDGYTSAAGWRAVEMARLVGPTLLAAIELALSLPTRKCARDGRILQDVVRANVRALDDIIRDWNWQTPDGASLQSLPMVVQLKAPGRDGQFVSWPPRRFSEAWAMLELLQASHLWIVALSLAARNGEVVEMEESCIRREESEATTGMFHTWKLDGWLGRKHEAPLPTVAVMAIKQQILLARLVKRLRGVNGDHLWVQTTSAGSGLVGDKAYYPNAILKKFNGAFGLETYMDGGRIHIHRFRKTLVRIVALALVHAPKVLMDILGHRDEQMTVMSYILADKGILVEIEEVTRELIILKGLEAVERLDHLEGRAAPAIRVRVAHYSRLMGRGALEPQNLREFVEVLTGNGGDWAVIGPGKVCTGFKRGGICNDKNGKPNPHYCSAECRNQLIFPSYETASGLISSAIVETIESVDYMISQLQQSDATKEEMLAAQFAGQIRGLLHQWREVDQHFRERYLNTPLVKRRLPNVVLLP
jgi:integrase